jgi:hypothetical protein
MKDPIFPSTVPGTVALSLFTSMDLTPTLDIQLIVIVSVSPSTPDMEVILAEIFNVSGALSSSSLHDV